MTVQFDLNETQCDHKSLNRDFSLNSLSPLYCMQHRFISPPWVATTEHSLGSIIGNISYQQRLSGQKRAVYALIIEQCSMSFDDPLIHINDPRTNITLY